MRKTSFLVVVVVVLSIFNPLRAQLVVTAGSSLSGWTPDSLVRNVLLGEGVEVFNVQYNGSSSALTCNAIGKFQSGTNDPGVGFSSGIIMCTGAASVAVGPNNSTGASQVCTCNGHTGITSPLDDLITQETNDEAILEFDFKPLSDSIKFRYVFASEEYTEFVGSINDVFGFFITGVNPNGGFYNNYNIAIIPGTSQAVCINNVNDVTNSSYYVNNPSQNYLQFDGATTVLTAQAKVVPCATYHLKLAIADAQDQVYDSGVFLEANSLSSNAVTFSFINEANPTSPSDLYEGCEATIRMHRPIALSNPTRIDISVEGDISNGNDFPLLNPYIYFPADTMDFDLVLHPYMDDEVEGTNGMEFAKIVLSPINGCPRSDSVEFNIVDRVPINIKIERDTLMNTSVSVQLRSVITGGMPNRTVTWLNANTGSTQTGETIVVNTFNDALYIATVEDACVSLDSDTMLIGVRRNFAIQSPDTILCLGEPLTLSVTGADSCVWSISGQAPFEMQETSVTIVPSGMVTYIVKSYIWWNGQIWEDIDSIHVITVPVPEVTVQATKTRICEGESVTLNAMGTSSYSWDGGNTYEEVNTHTFMPDTTTMYIIYGLTSGAECYGRDTIVITVDTVPDIIIGDGGGVCGGEEAEITMSTTAESFTWTSNPYDPTLSGQETHNTIVVNPDVTTVYTVNAVNGECSNSKSTTVAVEPPPVAIGEVNPKTVSLGNMQAVFTDVSENATTRKWEMPDGSMRTEQSVTWLVDDDVDSVNVRLWAYNPYMCFDSVTVTVYVDHTTLWVPNAFTPDESTNNTFLVKMNDIQRYHIFIYDRRGALVFESYDPEQAWDGRLANGEKCPQGVYTYLISCHKITYPYDQIIKKGTVVLVR